jgi:hypothetical protein
VSRLGISLLEHPAPRTLYRIYASPSPYIKIVILGHHVMSQIRLSFPHTPSHPVKRPQTVEPFVETTTVQFTTNYAPWEQHIVEGLALVSSYDSDPTEIL